MLHRRRRVASGGLRACQGNLAPALARSSNVLRLPKRTPASRMRGMARACCNDCTLRSPGARVSASRSATTFHNATNGCTPSSSSMLAPAPPALASVGRSQSFTATRSTGIVSSHGVGHADARASRPPMGPRSAMRSATTRNPSVSYFAASRLALISTVPVSRAKRRAIRTTCGTPSRSIQALSPPPRREPRPPARIPSVTSRAAIMPARSLPALDVPHEAPLLRDLALGQRVLRLVLVRILAFAEDEAHRRADELEALAEEILEVAPVAFRQRAQARAVHDERRRVLAARMRETQFRDMATHDRRRIGFVGDFERLRRFRRAELLRRRSVRTV